MQLELKVIDCGVIKIEPQNYYQQRYDLDKYAMFDQRKEFNDLTNTSKNDLGANQKAELEIDSPKEVSMDDTPEE